MKSSGIRNLSMFQTLPLHLHFSQKEGKMGKKLGLSFHKNISAYKSLAELKYAATPSSPKADWTMQPIF